jgi:cytochrome b561
MSYEFVAIAIPIYAVILTVIFGRAVQRFMIKAPIPAEANEERRRRALARIAALKWKLPADYKFDRDEANER